MLSPNRALPLKPTPPPFRNHGNYVVSVAELSRWLARQAEEAGAYILTETAAAQLLVKDGACAASARATRAAARTASRWATSSPAPTSPPRPRCWPRARGAT